MRDQLGIIAIERGRGNLDKSQRERHKQLYEEEIKKRKEGQSILQEELEIAKAAFKSVDPEVKKARVERFKKYRCCPFRDRRDCPDIQYIQVSQCLTSVEKLE